jgi:hypothetical protein
MTQKPDTDQGLSDAELLAMPAENVSPATPTRVWELHARHTQEKAQEAVETMAVQQHRQVDQKEHQQEEERRHERAVLEYQATMRAVQDRTERLLERIDREERRLEKRREEIDARAIRLKDGRRVYVDGGEYRDEEGRALTGADRAEAAAGRTANSATRQEKTRIEDQCEAARRLKEKTKELQSNVSNETHDNDSEKNLAGKGRAAKTAIAGLEQEFTAQVLDNPDSKNPDSLPADGSAFKTTSFAHAIAPGDDKTLRTDFAPASDGTAPERPKTAPAASPAPSL